MTDQKNYELIYLNELRKKLKNEISLNGKKDLLNLFYSTNQKLFCEWMNYLFNYNITFGLTSFNLKKKNNLVGDSKYLSFFELLNNLKDRKLTGNKAIKEVNSFIINNSVFEDLIYDIIDKDIKIRLDIKSINKIIPNCVPEFSVALGEVYEDQSLEGDWYVSRKLDGIRMILFWDPEKKDIKCFSRQGLEIKTLEIFKQKLIEDNFFENIEIPFVLDGELCREFNKIENFQFIMKEIRRKDYQMPIILNNYVLKYNVFDCMSLEIFEGRKNLLFSERLNILKIFKTSEVISIVDQKLYKEGDSLKTEENWEGLILRKNDFYKGKRSKDLLKVKEWKDEDYVVKSLIFTVKPILKKNKKWEDCECVGALVIDHKNFIQEVGSGLSDEQRLEWKKDPNKILNKIITVKYFEEFTNQRGEKHLRFPVLKTVHGEKREY